MKRGVFVFLVFWVAVMLVPCSAYAQTSEGMPERRDPFAWMKELNGMRLNQIRSELASRLGRDDPYSLWAIAELKMRLGDTEAERFYQQAIAAEPREPAFELFFADYFRNVRGPKKPLFPQAEKHYYDALRKWSTRESPTDWQKNKYIDGEIKRRVDRGLIALYQEDGLALIKRNPSPDGPSDERRPVLSFATINQYGLTTTDPDRVDDARSFTSEALFAQSSTRLNRPLTTSELNSMARAKELFETFDRVRFRYDEWPVVDLFYRFRNINNAQITNFFLPSQFNKVNLHEGGIAVEKPFELPNGFDAFLRGTYSRIAREGIIEFLPHDVEDINQYQVQGAISHFIGPDKMILDINYAYQGIDADIPNPPQRDRNIFSSKLTYQLLRPILGVENLSFYRSPFATRGVDFYAGYAHDVEAFGSVDVNKNDIFGGVTAKGFGPVDLTFQPAYFNGSVSGDPAQDMSMYRNNFTFTYRILDEEKYPGFSSADSCNFMGLYPAFLHFVIPFRNDIALSGPSYFENFRIGAELDAKLITIGRTTFLVSIGYDFQNFYNIDKNVNLFSLNLRMGF